MAVAFELVGHDLDTLDESENVRVISCSFEIIGGLELDQHLLRYLPDNHGPHLCLPVLEPCVGFPVFCHVVLVCVPLNGIIDTWRICCHRCWWHWCSEAGGLHVP